MGGGNFKDGDFGLANRSGGRWAQVRGGGIFSIYFFVKKIYLIEVWRESTLNYPNLFRSFPNVYLNFHLLQLKKTKRPEIYIIFKDFKAKKLNNLILKDISEMIPKNSIRLKEIVYIVYIVYSFAVGTTIIRLTRFRL